MRRTMTFAYLLKSSTFSLSRVSPAAAAAASNSRSGILCAVLQRTFSTESSPYHTIAITGSSGLVGKALLDELSKRESVNNKPIRVIKLERSTTPITSGISLPEEASVSSLPWNPNASGEDDDVAIDSTVMPSIDTIVHLAGENVATGLGPLGFLGIRPWSDSKKAAILNSRTGPTRAIAKAVASSSNPTTLISASGVGAYGDVFVGSNSPPAADEDADTTKTTGFLAEVSRQWEDATSPAAAAAVGENRVIQARFAPVLSKAGGALQKLYPVFFFGGGGIVGCGTQYFSYISARDAARALIHLIETPTLSGPVNVCAPNAVTNAEFTQAMGSVMNRPTFLPFPSFAVNLMFGEMGKEMLLGGVNARPKKLMESGFEFCHDGIEEALDSAIHKETI